MGDDQPWLLNDEVPVEKDVDIEIARPLGDLAAPIAAMGSLYKVDSYKKVAWGQFSLACRHRVDEVGLVRDIERPRAPKP
jgi:hypothetical protein